MKSEPLEEFQGSSLNPPFEVHSQCRVPSEFQRRSIYTPHISSQEEPHEECTSSEITGEFLRTSS